MRKVAVAIALFASLPSYAAYSRYSNQEETSATLREVLVALDDLKHEVHNHETEIRTFDEKARNFEEIIDSLRKQQTDNFQAMRESLKNLNEKIASQDGAAKGLSSSLQSHASDSATALTDYKKRIKGLEETVALQNSNIDNLQNSLRSLTEALQIRETPQKIATTDSSKIYRVKAGDSLGEIARKNQTSVKVLKELNGLTTDQIRVDQKLQLPG